MSKGETTRLLGVGRVAPDRHWHMGPQCHEFCELIVPLAGEMSVQIGGGEILGRPGMALLYPRGMVHEERSNPEHPVSTRFLAFNWDQDAGSAPLCADDHEGRIRQAVEWLYRDRDLAETPAVRRQRQAVLELILALYMVCATRNPQEDELVRNIRRHVREHLGEPILLQDLAEIAGLSRFHFVRAYRRLTGRTPMADVRIMRLEHARELLLTTALPLKQIAPLCGLGSEYALSRAFARWFEYPPSRLRRQAKPAIIG